MPQINLQQVLQLGLAHHRDGRLREAHAAYAQVLQHDPNNAEVLHLVGVVAHQAGRHEVAIETIGRAIALSKLPQAPMHFNLGNALHAAGRREEAVASLRRAIELAPAFAEASVNLAVVLNELRRHEEAGAAARAAIAVKPGLAIAHAALANALAPLGQIERAIASCLEAIRLQPDHPDALNTLANCYAKESRIALAIETYRRAIKLKPDYVTAHNNLAGLLRREGRADDALESFSSVARLRPDSPDAHNNLGVALKDAGRLDDADASFAKALSLQPTLADAHFNLGLVHEKRSRLDDASAALKAALVIEPDHIGALGLLGIVRMKQGLQHDEAMRLMRASLALSPNALLHDNLCLLSLYHPTLAGEEVLSIHRAWQNAYAPEAADRAPALGAHANDRTSGRTLNIGYVSPDFRKHASAHFIAPLIRGHDRSRVRVVCYSHVARPDPITELLMNLADGWRDIRALDDESADRAIREDRIDILVDLAGHTEDNRLGLFARRAAPVQVSMIGYPGTTGLSAIDYKISDALADPPGAERFYTEKLWRLPETFWCFDPLTDVESPDELPARRIGQITFGSANNVSKFSDEALSLWARIVAGTRGSRMLMQHSALASSQTRRRIIDAFASHGVSEDRLTLTGWTSFSDYTRLLRSFDIALDTFPFNGGTTTCQQLHAGVPCIAMAGDKQVSRMGVSMLNAVGLVDLVADSPEDYVAKAIALANDLDRLARIRATVREQMQASSLGDARRFARQLEDAYFSMCEI